MVLARLGLPANMGDIDMNLRLRPVNCISHKNYSPVGVSEEHMSTEFTIFSHFCVFGPIADEGLAIPY